MNSTKETPKPVQTDDNGQLQDVLYRCLRNWPWFLVSLAVTMSIATIYLLRTPNVYTRRASVSIVNTSKGRSISSEMEFDFGLVQSRSDVDNEMIMFNSPVIMTEVVKRLRLDMNYYLPGRFRKKVAYGTTLPATVRLLDVEENESSSCTVAVDAEGNLLLSDFVRNGEKQDSESLSGVLFDTLLTPLGRIIVEPTANFVSGKPYTLLVSRRGLYGTVAGYSSRLGVSRLSKQSTALELTISDNSTQRAEDVLNAVIAVYNENWVRERNQQAVSASIFINERLKVIEQELGSVESNISSYKSEHLITDVNAASSMYLAQSNQANAQIMDLNNQLYMTRYVRDYLADEENEMQLLPSNSGIASSNIESQISEYNRLLLQRNRLVANSSTQNPLVIDMDQNLAAMRSAMVSSIDNQIITLNAQLSSLQRREEQSTSRLAANPSQAKYLLSVERQQKVKESLYMFLLQKREENELSQAFTAYNTRLIAPPHGSSVPTSPVRRNILMIAFMLGLLIPAAVIYIRERTNTKVRGRQDLENVSIPFIGEIPYTGKRRRGLLSGKSGDSYRIVVGEGRRDIVNEAFRVLRTNLEFMTGKDSESNVIVLTSFNPSSGKSFITMNMAVSLAIKQKSVLVIDGDLRHGSASSYVDSPRRGLSDFLSGREDNLKDLIVKDSSYGYLSVLPIGTTPPNPTELLFSDRMNAVMDAVRGEYDYVLVDCPPVEMVADTRIIAEYADRTIFVIRAGLMEKSMLPELESLYESKKYRNMSIILNGTECSGSRTGYGYRYGYRYGYGYGYGGETDGGHRKKEVWKK